MTKQTPCSNTSFLCVLVYSVSYIIYKYTFIMNNIKEKCMYFIIWSSVSVINSAINSCEGFGRGYVSKYRSRANKENAQPKTPVNAASGSDQGPARRGLGLSAWGIVIVIVSLILAIMGMYYFSICYPIICQKNRKYDMMGLTSVA